MFCLRVRRTPGARALHFWTFVRSVHSGLKGGLRAWAEVCGLGAALLEFRPIRAQWAEGWAEGLG